MADAARNPWYSRWEAVALCAVLEMHCERLGPLFAKLWCTSGDCQTQRTLIAGVMEHCLLMQTLPATSRMPTCTSTGDVPARDQHRPLHRR